MQIYRSNFAIAETLHVNVWHSGCQFLSLLVFFFLGGGEWVGNGVDLKRKEISEGRKGIHLNQSSCSLLIIMVALDYLVFILLTIPITF